MLGTWCAYHAEWFGNPCPFTQLQLTARSQSHRSLSEPGIDRTRTIFLLPKLSTSFADISGTRYWNSLAVGAQERCSEGLGPRDKAAPLTFCVYMAFHRIKTQSLKAGQSRPGGTSSLVLNLSSGRLKWQAQRWDAGRLTMNSRPYVGCFPPPRPTQKRTAVQEHGGALALFLHDSHVRTILRLITWRTWCLDSVKYHRRFRCSRTSAEIP